MMRKHSTGPAASEAPLWTRRGFLQAGVACTVASTLSLTGCAHDVNAATPPLAPGKPAAGHSLRNRAAEHGALFGFAINNDLLRQNAAYRSTVLQQASVVVAENAMKWAPLRPSPDRYHFDEADYLVTFSEANRMKVRGHNLCWHEQLPGWFDQVATPANARQLLTEHIRTVAGRYSGRMHSWDVVNEAVWIEDGRPDGLRNSPWMKLIGSDYIELAFRTAREADPSALLTYNEYGIEEESAKDAEKRAATLLLLRRMRQRNVPLDAVGIQSHIKAGGQYGPALQQFIQACGEMDLQVFLTETDVNDRTLPAAITERDRAIAGTYASYLQAALSQSNVRAVLTWGVQDGQTWLNSRPETRREDGLPQRPLLFDDQFRPKPDCIAVLQELAHRAGSTGAPALTRPEAHGAGPRLPRL